MSNLYNKRMAICKELDVEETEKESMDRLIDNWNNAEKKKASLTVVIDGNVTNIALDSITSHEYLLNIRAIHTEKITELENYLIATTKHNEEKENKND